MRAWLLLAPVLVLLPFACRSKGTGTTGSGGFGGVEVGASSGSASHASSAGSTSGGGAGGAATSSSAGTGGKTSSSGGGGAGGASSSAGGAGGSGGVSASSTSASSAAASSSSSSSSSSGAGGGCAIGHLVINEVRSRGAQGANDEFIELWNPTASDVVLDATWKIEGRSSSALSYSSRWAGTGKTIPAHKHFLITGTSYAQMPASDEALLATMTDATSLRLVQSGTTIDAVCFAFDAATTAAFSAASYTCEGTPASNLPHDNTSSVKSNVDASIERKPCEDTNDNASDFAPTTPATPENSTM